MKHYSREQLGQFSDRLKEIVETKGTSVLEHRDVDPDGTRKQP